MVGDVMDNNFDALKIENQLCFPLYACAKEVVRKYKPYLDKIDLTYTQYITMMIMWDKKEINVKQLGECLYLDSGTLTPLLKKLEGKGFVSRERCSTDERSIIVRITEKGEELKKLAVSVPESMSTCVNLTTEEAQQLYRVLYKILGNL